MGEPSPVLRIVLRHCAGSFKEKPRSNDKELVFDGWPR